MIKTPLLTSLAFACALAAPAYGASRTLDFSGTTVDSAWDGGGHYSFAQNNGTLQVNINKTTPWAAYTYFINGGVDISSNPVVTTRMRADEPFELSLYISSSEGEERVNELITRRVFAGDNWQTITWDFSNTGGSVDRSNVDLLIFAVAGATTSHSGTAYFDEIRIGDSATAMANFTAPSDYSAYQGTDDHRIRIPDLQNASSISATGSSGIQNVSTTGISNGTAYVDFDIGNATSSSEETLTITANGSGSYEDYSYTLDVIVEANMAPTIGSHEDIVAATGEDTAVHLTGITDGNATAAQDVQLTASSDNTSVVPESFTFEHEGHSPYATLHFTASSSGQATITVTASEGGMQASTEFTVTVYDELNGAPTVNDPGLTRVTASGAATVQLTGVTDGDEGESQNLSVSAESLDTDIIPNPVGASYANGVVTLDFTPNAQNLGYATIEVTIEDDGGNGGNNGNQTTVLNLEIETIPEPALGYQVPLDSITYGEVPDTDPVPSTWEWLGEDEWLVEGEGSTQMAEIVQFDGGPALKIEAVGKTTWAGTWYGVPDIDVSEMPAISYEIYVEGATIGTHAYFWDDNGNRNADGAHAARVTVPEGVWTKYAVDYSKIDNGLLDADGNPINVNRIQTILFNYHPSFGWPFTDASFTVYIRNVRLGNEAEVDITNPDATLNPVPDQVFLADSEPQSHSITLRNITNGAGGKATVTAQTSGASVLQNLNVTETTTNRTALLTFETANTTGTATVTLTSSAPGAIPQELSFNVDVLSSTGTPASITVNSENEHQTIYGFGTFMFDRDSYIPLYANNLGASAMRIGLIGNQLEPVNDNSDPYVLDRSKLNYNALDFEKMRRLKANGVDTWILTSWTPPDWMKFNLSDDYQQAGAPNYEDTDNKLDPYFYEEFAESLVAAVRVIKEETGIELAAIGPQNEPAFNEPYGSAILSPSAFADVIAVVGARFEAEGINTRIFMPEQVFTQNHYSMAQYMAAVRANSEANQYTDIIATHGYAADGVGAGQPDFSAWENMYQNAQQGSNPKELWMTETFPEYANWGSALNYGMYLHGSLAHGNVGLWTSWGIENQLIELGTPLQSFYTFKNYSKYIRPGSVRVDASSSNQNLYVSAFKDETNNRMTVVAVNLAQTPLLVDLSTTTNSTTGTWEQYTTAQNRGFTSMGSTTGTSVVPARSVTTYVAPLEAPMDPPVIGGDLELSVTAGESIEYTMVVAGFANSLEAENLPAGLSFNAANGTISGIVTTAGTYNITLRATNDAGSDEETLELTIVEAQNQAPTASFVPTLNGTYVPLTVDFDASLSSDNDGSIASYSWDFGDGSNGSGMTVSHEFTDVGSYDVVLTVTDNDGATDDVTRTISAIAQPVITFRRGPTPITELNVSPSGGTYAIYISPDPADAEWELTTDAEWVSIPVPTGSSETQIDVVFEHNTTGSERVATLSAWSNSIQVIQPSAGELQITSGDTIEMDSSGNLEHVLEAEGGITPYTWTMISAPEGTILNAPLIIGQVTETGTIEIELTDNVGTTVTQTITVTREGGSTPDNPWTGLPHTGGFVDTGAGDDEGIGWVYDANWPWLFVYGCDLDEQDLGDWLWVMEGYDEAELGFWAYNSAGDVWMWCSPEWGWYYLTGETGGWFAFNR